MDTDAPVLLQALGTTLQASVLEQAFLEENCMHRAVGQAHPASPLIGRRQDRRANPALHDTYPSHAGTPVRDPSYTLDNLDAAGVPALRSPLVLSTMAFLLHAHGLP